jgi:hypothetical protein
MSRNRNLDSPIKVGGNAMMSPADMYKDINMMTPKNIGYMINEYERSKTDKRRNKYIDN